jgi:hypothetical protein
MRDSKYHQGKFHPQNPEKYKGDTRNIVYRSSWEVTFMRWCDRNPGILEWGSEEFFIPYFDPTTNKVRRYFPDFFIKVQENAGNIKKYIIEVKPKKQTMLKENASKKEKLTWIVNVAKWKAAELYCQKHNFVFKLLTEKELFSNA